MQLHQTWTEALDRIDRYHQEAERERIGAASPQNGSGRRRMAGGLRAAAARLARFADRLERKTGDRWNAIETSQPVAPSARA